MRLEKIISIEASIRILSGIHIGAGSDEIKIGGIDNPVIKNPLDNLPYLPGSSIKGKMRSLLEISTGRINKDDKEKPFYIENASHDFLCKMFGNGKTGGKYQSTPTRLIFNDASLKNAQALIEADALTEDKAEVLINRSTGKANPRHIERVPAGAKFDFRASLKVFTGDKKEEMRDFFILGLLLLELDALGGSSSRGYGRIKFEEIKFDGADIKLKEYNLEKLLEDYQYQEK